MNHTKASETSCCWTVVSDLERGLVLKNQSFHDAKILNGINGTPVHARTLVGQNESHQWTEFSRRIEEVRLACRLHLPQPIHGGSAGFWASRASMRSVFCPRNEEGSMHGTSRM
jgi:hypothetical protein